MSKVKLVIYGAIGLFVLYSVFFRDSEPEQEWVEEEVVTPTQGLITTVKEMEADLFKIEDEVNVPAPEDSRIIANYLDNTSDTFTLDEARLVAADENGGRRSGVARAASYGFMGFMMGRMMGGSNGFRPSAGAYVDPKTYNKVSNGAGNTLNRTANRTTVRKPSGVRSGGGRSTRSVGG